MVQIIPQLGALGTQIGAGLGKGLSEQVPKEIERFRLRSGLEQLKNAPSSSPIDNLIKLYSTPGVSPEMAQNIEPYLRNLAAVQGQREAKRVQSSPLMQTQQSEQQGQFTSEIQPKQPIESGKFDPLQIPVRLGTEEALRNRALEFVEQNPNLYPTIEKGYEQAQREFQRQEQSTESLKNNFDEILSKKLQKGGKESYSDVLGDLQNDFYNRALNEVLRGKLSPQQAANKYAEQAKDFAMANQELKTIGGTSFLSTTPSKNLSRINTIRKKFAEYGQLEPFKDELIATQNLTEPYANYIAYPPSENKEISNALRSIPKQKFSIEASRREGANRPIKEFSEKFAKAITPKDSILATGIALQSKNLDASAFVDEIQNLYDKGEISLTERQRRELAKSRTFRPSLGDLYLFMFSGLGKEFGD